MSGEQVGGAPEGVEETSEAQANEAETSSQQSQTPDIGAEIANLRETVQALYATVAAPKKEPVPARKELSPAEIDKLKRENAEAYIDYVVANKVHDQVSNFAKQQERKEWDQRTERDFPQIKKDREFQSQVAAEYQAQKARGEFPEDSPFAVYRATERVAARMFGAKGATAKPASGISAEAPRSAAPAPGKQGAPNPAFDAWVKMTGIKDKKWIEETRRTWKSSGGRKK